MRRSPAPQPEIPGPRVAAVRPPDPTARFSTNFCSSSGRFRSSLRDVPRRAYLTGLLSESGMDTWRRDAYPYEWQRLGISIRATTRQFPERRLYGSNDALTRFDRR